MKIQSNSRHTRFWIALGSAAVSASVCLLSYVGYLQSFGISLYRLLAALAVFSCLAWIIYLSTGYLLARCFGGRGATLFQYVVFWAVISALFAPYILPVPHYPASPLFRKSSELEIDIRFSEPQETKVQLKGIWLAFDDEKYSYSDFRLSDDWVSRSGRYFIDPLTEGRLTWEGKIGERAKLTIFPMDEPAYVTVKWDGEEYTSILEDSSISFVKKTATPFGYYVLIVMVQFIVLGYLLLAVFAIFDSITGAWRKKTVIWLFILGLSFILVYIHFQSNDITERFDLQIAYHQGILSGQSLDPWQYRVLSEWLLAGLIRLLSPMEYAKAFYLASLLVRLTQNALIYCMAYSYFRKLNSTETVSLIGILFLSGSLLNSYYNTGFSLNTYFDVFFYLFSMLLILNQSFAGLPLLMIFAALNRETSGLIPFLALAAVPEMQNRKPKMVLAISTFFCWLAVFFSLRLSLPPSDMFIPYGNEPGIPLLKYNLLPQSLFYLPRFFSVVPILGLAVWKQWPTLLKRSFLIIIPLWFVVHLVASVIAETRLFLVPQIIVFIPAFLVFIEKFSQKIGLTSAPVE